MYEEELTYKIRGAVFEVYRQLGHGFLESVYQKALMYEQGKSMSAGQEHECLLYEHYVSLLVVPSFKT